MALTVHKRDAQQQESDMSVTLKQRTYRTEDGRAVPEGHAEAAFLVGPAGAKVTDDQAKAMGLKNGAIPGEKPAADAEAKSEEPTGDKSAQPEGDKSGKRGRKRQ